MKHLKIILTLTLTVVLFSLAVFFVEGFTTPVRTANVERKANAAKFEVMPSLDEEADRDAYTNYYAPFCEEDNEKCMDSDYDFSGTQITKLYIIPEKGYIYESEGKGYSTTPFIYLISLDLEKNIIGFEIVQHTESSGIGALMIEEAFIIQFAGMTLTNAQNGMIDAQAGASFPITLGGLKVSVKQVMTFHDVNFGGAIVETPEQKLARWYQELSAAGATFTDVSLDNALPTNITKMEIANDGSADVAAIYTVDFQGYLDVNKYMMSISLDDGSLLGLRVLEANDTPGLGTAIENQAFLDQFTGMTQETALAGTLDLDGLAGATPNVTVGAMKLSIAETINFHKSVYDGVVVLTPEEKLALWIEEMAGSFGEFTDVSSDYTLDGAITKVEVLQFGGANVMALYTVTFDGYATGSVYKVAVAIETGNILDVYMVTVNETTGIGAEINNEDFLAQFEGMLQLDAEEGNFDEQAGASYPVTLGGFATSLNEVVSFHKQAFQGIVVETFEEMVVRYKEELSVIGATLIDVSGDYDLTSSPISKVEMANDGSEDVAVVFTVVFQGYNDNKDTIYLVAFDLETGNMNGLRVIEAGDTTGIGSEIMNDDFYTQFVDMTQEDAQAGSFDEQAGASYPITLGDFAVSLDDAVDFYKVEFGGETVETLEEMIARYFVELTAVGAVLTDVSGDYTLPSGVTKVELANNGSEDFAVVFTMEFEGYTDNATIYLVSFDLATGDLIGLRVIEAGDTAGIGSLIMSEDFDDQFADMLQNDALAGGFDEQAGASYPITLGAFEGSLEDAVNFYITEFTEETVETYEEMVARYYEELSAVGAVITDDSSNHTLGSGVTKVELANNGSEDFAVIFTVEFTSAYTTGGEVNEYIISFDLATGEIIGVRFLQANDTAGIGAEIMNELFYAQFTDITKTTAQAGGFDEQAGASYPQTLIAFESSIDDVVDYYVVEYETPERPAPVAASNAMLLQGYPGADHFVQVYENYPYNESIGNVYEVYDAVDTLLGYVYIGQFTGVGGNIYLAWGIDLTGTSLELAILIENETWDQNTANYDDGTWGTDFQTSIYNDQFDGIAITSILFSPIDDIAGVSTTTGGLNATLETIVEYHLTEIVGGAN